MTFEQPFWRTTPLTAAEARLLQLVRAAHIASCRRPNTSAEVFKHAAASSGNYLNGVMAALATLGGPHAPIPQTMWLLQQDELRLTIQAILAEGKRVPGWGNSFVKGEPDDLWTHVDNALDEDFPALHATLRKGTNTLHEAGKRIFPNPSAYTACAAIAVGLPAAVAPWLFVSARLDGWTRLHLEQLNPPPGFGRDARNDPRDAGATP